MAQVKFNYNKEMDLLGIKNGKFYQSVELIDGLWVDLDKKKNIVGVEVNDASKLFSKLSSDKVGKSFLDNLKSVSFDVTKYGSGFIIHIVLRSANNIESIANIPVYDIYSSSNVSAVA